MEVVAASPAVGGGTAGPVPPYQRRDVEEWSRLDQLTGMLEHARVETDHWAANTHNTAHKYGKVVDSRDRCAPDGTQRQRQRRQLEVFQAHVPGGSLQVIRTQTVATSTSRWATTTSTSTANGDATKGFDNLQLTLNPLDLSSQKTKASVGRSGSIGGRRPPSRPRSLVGRSDENDVNIAQLQQKVSRLCHQIHQQNEIEIETNATTTDQREQNNKRNSLEQFEDWKRAAKNRRSLQISSNSNSSSKNSKSDLDTDRRLNTALRNNNIDLKALDQILKTISTNNNVSEDLKTDLNEEPERDTPERSGTSSKRHSFITVESLQEVRGRLRKLSSPVNSYTPSTQTKDPKDSKDEEPDDGIAEDSSMLLRKEEAPIMPASNTGVSRVRSYVYGVEAMLHNKKPIIGTGSLESRTSNKINGTALNRTEDWYNRRKSYGFEQVHNQQIDHLTHGKSKMESSTDSGICRSTEIVIIPTTTTLKSETKITTNNKNSTIINLNSDDTKPHEELYNIWNRRAAKLNDESEKVKTEPVTITIPIVSDSDSTNSTSARRMFHRQMSDGTSVSVESSWANPNNSEVKRHSIAVDESKYVSKQNEMKPRCTSFSTADYKLEDPENDETNSNFNKKNKKVEFCKTEVHFVADSGRVNIVETDEKPPPTQNFRRRRRNSNHLNEDLALKTGYPLIHFGDTSYEKKLFGISDQETESLPVPTTTTTTTTTQENNVVTISSVAVTKDYESDQKENENQRRGILKNKMIKPKPYLLGDDNNEILARNESGGEESENSIWGVRLRPVNKQESPPPMWRSTVTVQNTTYNKDPSPEPQEETKPEFQKLLNSLRSPRKTESVDRSSPVIPVAPVVDFRRSSWSVADRVKQVEDMRNTENKGYSTRVNFGGGEATVVENVDLLHHNTTWPRQEDAHAKDETKQTPSILNKRLVVRIGRDESSANHYHSVCSTTESKLSSNIATTTTKITIDMSSPTQLTHKYKFSAIKLPRASLHSLKSTPLVLNTFASSAIKSCAIPDQLAALRKLYDDAAEHSDDSERADEEVRSYMSGGGDDSDRREEDDNDISSVSGSWSKMRAFRNVKQHLSNVDVSRHKDAEMFREIISRHAFAKKDVLSVNSSFSNGIQRKPTEPLINSRYEKQLTSEAKVTPVSLRSTNNIYRKSSDTDSPIIERKQITSRSNHQYNKLSSPSLVGRSVRQQSVITQQQSAFSKVTSPRNIVRNSPKSNRRLHESQRNDKNKPDLLQNHVTDNNNREYVNLSAVVKESSKSAAMNSSNKTKMAGIKKVTPSSTINNRTDVDSPIYENIDEILGNEKESSILLELTRAADQILQAVNGYTDESTDECDRRHLSTISETKSWKQTEKPDVRVSRNARSKTHASSTSSVESVSRDYHRPMPPVRHNRASRLQEDRTKKKILGSNSELSKATKARRLQRASSREALLQSHGSSSEDMSINLEVVRKPKLVRRTKNQSEEMTSGVKRSTVAQPIVPRRRECEIRRSAERMPVVGLQEIRHKTAVSTIRSTAEKAANRERVLKAARNEEHKRRSSKDLTHKSSNLSHHRSTAVASTTMSSSSTTTRADPAGDRYRNGSNVGGSAVRTSNGVLLKRGANRNEGVVKH